MPSYDLKLETIKNAVIYFVKQEAYTIYNIHPNHREFKFKNFITNISVYYVSKFHEEFYQYINYDTGLQLECAARNIGYALKTYFKVNTNCTLSNIDNFTTEFLNIQFEDFDKWCYDLYLSYSEGQDEKKNHKLS